MVAHFAKAGNASHARAIAAQHLRPQVIELPLAYPVTTELPKCSNGYRDALRDFYDEAAATIAAHLEAGRIVAVICEGDPLFYGSYMHLHTRLAPRFPRRDRRRRHRHVGLLVGGRHADRTGRRRLHRAARDLAGGRAGAPACRRRRRGGDESRPASAESAPRAWSAAAGCRAPSMSSAAPWRTRK